MDSLTAAVVAVAAGADGWDARGDCDPVADSEDAKPEDGVADEDRHNAATSNA